MFALRRKKEIRTNTHITVHCTCSATENSICPTRHAQFVLNGQTRQISCNQFQ
jgi:hypothetical protein